MAFLSLVKHNYWKDDWQQINMKDKYLPRFLKAKLHLLLEKTKVVSIQYCTVLN